MALQDPPLSWRRAPAPVYPPTLFTLFTLLPYLPYYQLIGASWYSAPQDTSRVRGHHWRLSTLCDSNVWQKILVICCLSFWLQNIGPAGFLFQNGISGLFQAQEKSRLWPVIHSVRVKDADGGDRVWAVMGSGITKHSYTTHRVCDYQHSLIS